MNASISIRIKHALSSLRVSNVYFTLYFSLHEGSKAAAEAALKGTDVPINDKDVPPVYSKKRNRTAKSYGDDYVDAGEVESVRRSSNDRFLKTFTAF